MSETRSHRVLLAMLALLAAGIVAAFAGSVAAFGDPRGWGTIVPGIAVSAGTALTFVLAPVVAAAGWLSGDLFARVATASSPGRVLAWLGTALLVVLVAAVFEGEAALLVGLSALATVAFWWVLPLTIGSLAAGRAGVPFRYVLAAWPATTVAGVLLVATPWTTPYLLLSAGVSTQRRALGFVAIAALVAVGPGALATVAGRLRSGVLEGPPEEA